MPDLTNPQWAEKAERAGVLAIITHGQGMMPGFGDVLPASAIEALTSRVLGKPPGGEAPEGPMAGEATAGETPAEPTTTPGATDADGATSAPGSSNSTPTTNAPAPQ